MASKTSLGEVGRISPSLKVELRIVADTSSWKEENFSRLGKGEIGF